MKPMTINVYSLFSLFLCLFIALLVDMKSVYIFLFSYLKRMWFNFPSFYIYGDIIFVVIGVIQAFTLIFILYFIVAFNSQSK